jgi:hypothetical protein
MRVRLSAVVYPTAILVTFVLSASGGLRAQSTVTSPKEHFGFNIGDDYHLATYTQLESYWHKLAEESSRFSLEEMGKTAEGRTEWLAVITAPENFAGLDGYKEISRRLALANDLTDEEARGLAQEGKAVAWIDGGLHASEVVGAQQLIQLSYELASFTDAETQRFLDDLIILLAPVNPDGMELVSSWYMRRPEPTERSMGDVPRLYQKYIGHDNNRDFYRVAQPETENAARVMFREWFPQLAYNHHQTGPSDIFVFVPPFREPPGYWYDPLLVLGNQAVGLAMHQRLATEGKGGAGMRQYANYSTWYNGSIRTVGYYHNQIGMLTEMKGSPTPMELAFYPDRQLAANDFPLPHTPGVWHFQQSIDYSITLDRAFLDYASRNRENVLYNRYVMGRRNIEKGSRDNWTVLPHIVYEVNDSVLANPEDAPQLAPTFRRRGPGVSKRYLDLFRRHENRDPRGFIIPSNQPDFPTAVEFVNTLIKNGVDVLQATENFTVLGKRYPAGSFVIKAAQAFRPHVLDMFEPQNHPNDFLYPGGPPIPPYDNAGWTLAFQMGLGFDRILEGFDGPFERVDGLAMPLPGTVTGGGNVAGYLFSHRVANSAIAVNRLLAGGQTVFWLTEPVTAGQENHPEGTIYVRANGSLGPDLEEMARDLGLSFEGVSEEPDVTALALSQPRVGLWDRYGGSMPSGWTRWLLERFEFPFEVVFPPRLDAGRLNAAYDALVFPTEAIPAPGENDGSSRLPDPQDVPEVYRENIGVVSEHTTIPRLEEFLNSGGSVLTIGSSATLAQHLGLPVKSHLVDGNDRPLPPDQFFIPSSIVRVKVDTLEPLGYGLAGHVDVAYDESPVLRFEPDADRMGVRQVSWFDSDRPLRSGWAWGQDRLYGGTAVAQADVGQGTLFLFGPEILFRAQPQGAFNLFFNALYLSTAREVRLGG